MRLQLMPFRVQTQTDLPRKLVVGCKPQPNQRLDQLRLRDGAVPVNVQHCVQVPRELDGPFHLPVLGLVETPLAEPPVLVCAFQEIGRILLLGAVAACKFVLKFLIGHRLGLC